MSNIEGQQHDFDDLNMPTEEFGTLAGGGMPDPTARQKAAAEGEAPAEVPDEEPSPNRRGTGLLGQITQADPYTVMLAISLAAILLAVFCLFREYGTYRYDRSAKTLSAVCPALHAASDDHWA